MTPCSRLHGITSCKICYLELTEVATEGEKSEAKLRLVRRITVTRARHI
jgi:hypothetical protein